MLVTYDKKLGHFVSELSSVTDKRERIMLRENAKWVRYNASSFATSDPRAARTFYGNMDAPTKRYIDRLFMRRYSFTGKLPKLLDPVQRDGVKWALTRSRSYLAHAPGAGKTIEAIVAAVLTPGPGPAVFIVPPSLTANWEREVTRFVEVLQPRALKLTTVIPESLRADTADWGADYIIVPDSMLHKKWVLGNLLKLRPRFLSADEASRFKEPTSIRAVALFGGKTEKGFKSPGLIYTPRHVVLLDGSPMPNRSVELWAPTYAMAPESIDFMSRAQFGLAYCDPKKNVFGGWEFKGSTNSEKLKERLQREFMHVVTEDKLGHSPRLRSLVFVDDTRPKTVKAWEKKWVSGHAGFAALAESNQDPGGKLATMRKEAGIAMVGPATRYIKERMETGEAVIVFAWHREVVLALEKALKKYSPGLIMGGVDKNDREAFLTRFQGGKLDLLIMNIAAGGRGNNIQRADRCIFVEPSWSDQENIQCEKRASRRGRDVRLPVKADYLVVAGSINERVLSACFTKEARVKKVIG